MVNKELSAHGEEREVVIRPCDHEETGGVVKPIPHVLGDGREAPSSGQLVGSENSDEDRDRHDTKPPTDDVADHVNLFPLVTRSRPETDTAEEERPVDGARGVGVAVGEAGVVL